MGTFAPRVSQNVDTQPLDVRENGQGLGPLDIIRTCTRWEHTGHISCARFDTNITSNDLGGPFPCCLRPCPPCPCCQFPYPCCLCPCGRCPCGRCPCLFLYLSSLSSLSMCLFLVSLLFVKLISVSMWSVSLLSVHLLSGVLVLPLP